MEILDIKNNFYEDLMNEISKINVEEMIQELNKMNSNLDIINDKNKALKIIKYCICCDMNFYHLTAYKNYTYDTYKLRVSFGFEKLISKIVEHFANDKEVVIAAVCAIPSVIEYASDKLKNDKEVVMAALPEHLPYVDYDKVLKYVSEDLRNDKEVIMMAIEKGGGMALEYASERLKDDKDVVMAAVYQNGFALKYASERLKDDKEVVMTAFYENYRSLIYASDKQLLEIDSINNFYKYRISCIDDDEIRAEIRHIKCMLMLDYNYCELEAINSIDSYFSTFYVKKHKEEFLSMPTDYYVNKIANKKSQFDTFVLESHEKEIVLCKI